MKELDAQSLSNRVWTFAALAVVDMASCHMIAEQVPALSDSFRFGLVGLVAQRCLR